MANTTVTTQRISQLPTSNTVVAADTFPFLQANTGLTKTVNGNGISAFVSGVANNINIPSQGTSNVAFFTTSNVNFVSMNVKASEGNNYTYAKIITVLDANASIANSVIQQTSVGLDPIYFSGSMMSGANLNLMFSRTSNTTANVNIDYTYKVK